MSAATASIALLRIAHPGLGTHATRRHLDLERLSVDHFPVQLLDGLVDVVLAVQVDEAVVADDVALDDGPVLGEEFADFGRACFIGQIADKDLGGDCIGGPTAFRSLHLDGQRIDHVAVEVLDGVARLLLALHVHEPVILNHVALDDGAVLFKEGL